MSADCCRLLLSVNQETSSRGGNFTCFSHVCNGVKRADLLHALCARVTANFLRPFAWCVVCALTLSRTALMHLDTAGEGPPNQVLQTHKSVACAQSIAAHLLYFAGFLCWVLSDVTLLVELTCKA